MVKINADRAKIANYNKPVYSDPTEILLEFTKVLSDAGLIITGLPDTSGKIQRVSTRDDKGRQKSGWYVAFDGEVFGAAYGNFKTGEEGKWSSIERHSMTSGQLAENQRQIQVATKEREAAQNEIYREAAKEAESIMSKTEISSDHPYAKRKNISGEFRTYKGTIAIPAYDENSNISTIQFISPDGTKKFLTGGKKKGSFHLIAGETDTVYICEGWATGRTINEATGKTVAVAFDSGNLMSATENVKIKFSNSILIVAGDDDHENNVNVGRVKAEAVATTLGIKALFPCCSTGESDFNDIGISKTKEIMEYSPEFYERNGTYDGFPEKLLNPPGILSDIARYYNATARSKQEGFAVQAALAIGSVVCGRRYITTKRNLTSLYFLNVADSGTGKEHILTVIQEVLKASKKEHLLIGSGYTSAGAVFSALLLKPRHICVIDEFGRYLRAANNNGNSHLQEANTKLMEAIGRLSNIMHPSSYSTMTLRQNDAKEMNNKLVYFPAITLAAMTTPSTLVKNISSENVSDGFLGRFILHISNREPQIPEHKDWIKVPSHISDWIEKIDRNYEQSDECATEEPSLIEMSFDQTSIKLLDEYEGYKLDLRKQLKLIGLDALPSRCVEFAMRIAIIVELAKNPHSKVIQSESTSWSIEYVKFAFNQMIDFVKEHVSDSIYERNCKNTLEAIRSAGEKGISKGLLFKRAPLKSLEPRAREGLLEDLINREQIWRKDKQGLKGGRPTSIYFPLKQLD